MPIVLLLVFFSLITDAHAKLDGGRVDQRINQRAKVNVQMKKIDEKTARAIEADLQRHLDQYIQARYVDENTNLAREFLRQMRTDFAKLKGLGVELRFDPFKAKNDDDLERKLQAFVTYRPIAGKIKLAAVITACSLIACSWISWDSPENFADDTLPELRRELVK